jgi:hypothetical protein
MLKRIIKFLPRPPALRSLTVLPGREKEKKTFFLEEEMCQSYGSSCIKAS